MSISRTVWFAAMMVVATMGFGQEVVVRNEAKVVAELRAKGVEVTLDARGRAVEVLWDALETEFNDADLERTASLLELREIWLIHSEVTDAGLRHLPALKHLEVLGLVCEYRTGEKTTITDAGMKHIKRLTSLKKLRIEDGDVTDQGLIDIGTLTQLEDLDLFGTEISDAGLPHLRMLTKLKYLNVGECQWEIKHGSITAGAARELKKYLPDCDIDY